jgi:hypothetical protein
MHLSAQVVCLENQTKVIQYKHGVKYRFKK